MSEEVLKLLGEGLRNANSDWALAEDSAKAVLRVAADKSINGRHPFPWPSKLLGEQKLIVRIRASLGCGCKIGKKGGIYGLECR
jgi:hypothetical protein